MKAIRKYIVPLVMAGAAATAIGAAPIAAAESIAAITSTSITHYLPQDPAGSGCSNGTCGSGDASGGSGCTADGTCGSGGPLGGGGCNAQGVCGHGGPGGGGGCVPWIGCFNYGS